MFLLVLSPPFCSAVIKGFGQEFILGFVNLQDQFALALSQAVGAAGKKEDELVGSKLNKVHATKN